MSDPAPRSRLSTRRSDAIRLVLAMVLAVVGSPLPALAETGLIEGLRVQGSPFSPNGDGFRDSVGISFRLNRPATSAVDVVDHDGGVVRRVRLERMRPARRYELAWDGRNDAGSIMANGPYRIRVSARDDTEETVVEALVTKARYVLYPPDPKAVLIAIDPGHGSTWPGAVAPDGSREADFNLDIGLRLRAMLEGARGRVVMTRTTDADANDPAWDRDGDGLIEYRDDLAARPDVANLARADVFLALHNNLAISPTVGGPSTFYNPDRSFSAESARLAGFVQRHMVARLLAYRTDTWRPYDHGVLRYDYYVLAPYAPPRLPRPTLMPGILGESLFLSHPFELSLLKLPEVRQSIAVAYYNAVAEYLAGRPDAAGYRGSLSTELARPGEAMSASVKVTARGMSSAAGWTLDLHAVPAAVLYDGSGSRGEPLGSMPLPDLAPGTSVRMEIGFQAPSAAGTWIIKADVRLPDGSYLSDRGSPALQLPLTTVSAEPSTAPEPSVGTTLPPEPSPEPSPVGEP